MTLRPTQNLVILKVFIEFATSSPYSVTHVLTPIEETQHSCRAMPFVDESRRFLTVIVKEYSKVGLEERINGIIDKGLTIDG
jgi:hypothetical protein